MNEVTISKKSQNIPMMEIGLKLPYTTGSCPRKGWYAIERAGEYAMDAAPAAMLAGKRGAAGDSPRCVERLRHEDLVALVGNFDPDVNGGNGLLLNECHLHLTSAHSDKAKGFIRALACRDDVLYGYLELTETAHAELNGGEFWAVSAEYPYEFYELTEQTDSVAYYAPRYLAGMALTNNPDNKSQVGLCRYKTQQSTMKRTRTTAALHTAAPDEDEQKLNNTTEEEQELHTEADEEQELHTAKGEEQELHSENAADDWQGFADEVASIFGLPADMSGEEILAYLRQHKADFDALAAAGSAPAGETATHCRPRFKAASQTRLHTAATPKVNLRANRTDLCATHCQKSVASAAAANGGSLDPKSFQSIWDNAEAEFNQQN